MTVTLPGDRWFYTDDLYRLTQKDLMQCARLGIGESLRFVGEQPLGGYRVSLLATRKELCIDFRDRVYRQNIEVPLSASKITYGWRWWLGCSRCKRRCAVLYYMVFPFYGLICRKCFAPKYETQNASLNLLHEYLDKKHCEMFERIWPGDLDQYNFDDSETPKPVNRWWRTFNNDLEKLELAEYRYSMADSEKARRFIVKGAAILQRSGYDLEEIFK